MTPGHPARRLGGLQRTGKERHLLIPRVIAGAPLLFIGLMHVFSEAAPMRPLVEEAGLPAAGVLSPIAVTIEIVAGAMLLLGLHVRLAALLAIPTMAVAAYAHVVIDVWPNTQTEEPPIALPLAVLACSSYVLWRGAGRWSIDRWATGRPRSTIVATEVAADLR